MKELWLWIFTQWVRPSLFVARRLAAVGEGVSPELRKRNAIGTAAMLVLSGAEGCQRYHGPICR
ncbi:MAG: hypothetical protein DMG72_18290 [Acidobacteria bacterium]|nr:MAG: hypothetical protein DMG72_18290 [Acidobacteriota bacterium]